MLGATSGAGARVVFRLPGWGDCRSTIEEALQAIGTRLDQEFGVLLPFDGFGNDEHVELLGDRDQGADHGLIVMVCMNAPDKLPVDLHRIEEELAKMSDRRGAEHQSYPVQRRCRVAASGP